METKTDTQRAAYKFAETILGQPPLGLDDTIVVGFIEGAKYADQELASLRDQSNDQAEIITYLEKKNQELVRGVQSLINLYYAGYTIYPSDLEKLKKNLSA